MERPPQFEQSEDDPRRDLLKDESYFVEKDPDIKPPTKAAQMMEITLGPGLDEGQTLIIIKPGKPEEVLYLPQNEDRLEWEKWNDEDHPVFRNNVAAAEALEDVYRTGKPLTETHIIKSARVGIGGTYEFLDDDGTPMMAIRINNDPNNVYEGHGNPCSGLIKELHRNSNPFYDKNGNLDEIIPALRREYGINGEISPLFPNNFKRNSWSNYKRTVAGMEGTDIHAQPRLKHVTSTPFQNVDYNLNVSVAYDLSNLGGSTLESWHGVNARLTPQATLEVEGLSRIAKPDFWFDPTHHSYIVLASITAIGEWYAEYIRKGVAPLALKEVIDGKTGLRVTDPAIEEGFRGNFKGSPPFLAIGKAIHDYEDKRLN